MKLLLPFLLTFHMGYAQIPSCELQGTVVDENNEPIPFARILVYDFDETIVGGAEADFDGKFRISTIPPGSYDVVFTANSYGIDTFTLIGVDIKPERITSLDSIELKMSTYFQEPKTLEMKSPRHVILKDPFGPSITIEPEDIRRP